MMKAFAVLVLLTATASAQQQGINCSGPTGEAWSASQNGCASQANTSCDSVNQTTCYYAGLIGGGDIGGVFDKKTGIFIIGYTGPIPDIQKGDQLRAMGAATAKRLTNVRTAGSLTKYTKARPARSLRLRVFRPRTGTWLTVTWRRS